MDNTEGRREVERVEARLRPEIEAVGAEVQQGVGSSEMQQGADMAEAQQDAGEVSQPEVQPVARSEAQSELAKAALEAEQAIHQLVNMENGYQNADKMPEGAVPFGGASEQQVNERLQEQQMQQDEEVGEGQMKYIMLAHDRLTKKAVQQTEETVKKEVARPSELKKDVDRLRKEFIYHNFGWTPESEN